MEQGYHQVLARQIRKILGESPELSPQLRTLLKRISDTYTQFDEDHALVERSLELSSRELTAINRSVEEKVQVRTQQLQDEHTRFIASIDSLDVGFLMCDAEGKITLTNPSIRKILARKWSTRQGTQEAELHTDPSAWTLEGLDQIMRPELHFKEAVDTCLKTGKRLEFEEVTFGTRVLRLFMAPIISIEGRTSLGELGTVILIEDITEEKVLERSKDEFFTIASHELRTPLTAIKGNSFMIRRYFSDQLHDQNMTDMIEDIHQSAVRLIEVVNDFLDVTALEQDKAPLKQEVFLPAEVVGGAVNELQAMAAAKGLSLAVDGSVANAPAVVADKVRIQEVLYNLIDNALQFTSHGGVTVSVLTDERSVYFRIADTGSGIPPERQRFLFHKFQQAGSSLLTRDTTRGTGLGLYIAKLVVERSGGEIGLESSEPGKGSVFRFSLPRAMANSTAG